MLTTYILIFMGVVIIASLWKLFIKAGEQGWLALIPIINLFILVRIVRLKWWWFLFLFCPFSLYMMDERIVYYPYVALSLIFIAPFSLIIVLLSLAEVFEKSRLFGIGIVFLPFLLLPILAFGNSTYQKNEHSTPLVSNEPEVELSE